MSTPAVIPEDLLRVATPEELELYETHLRLEIALRSPLDYAVHCTPSTERYKHIELLNEHILALSEGRLYVDGPGPPPAGYGDDAVHPQRGDKPVDQLAISMPPRHGKSYLTSEHTPAWFETKYPEYSTIVASYEADFAAGWGRKIRNLIEGHPEFGVQVAQDSRAADHFSIDGHRGEVQTAGVGGPITGKGAHLLVIDDPIKNSDEANSERDRKSKKEWMLTTATTRLEPYPVTGRLGPTLLMATRWHEDDLIGWATKAAPHSWCVLNLPALAEENDPLGRAEGEALCPERFTAKQLINKRDNGDEEVSGLAAFNALYQGHPSTEGTGIFRRASLLPYTAIRERDTTYYTLNHKDGHQSKVLSTDCFRFQTIDLAASTKSSADFTVIATWDVTKESDLILHDLHRARMESADHSTQVETLFQRLKPKFIGVERQTFGLTLIQNLLRAGRPVRELKADTDKFSRAIPAGLLADNGKLFIPQSATWVNDFIEELVQFDHGAHDDQVDVLAYAVKVMQSLPQYRKPKAPLGNSLEEKVARQIAKLDRKRPRQVRHPELGRIG